MRYIEVVHMEIIDILAYAVGILTTAVAVLSMQFKSMRIVLLLQIVANGLLGLQYAIRGADTGVWSLSLGVVQIILSYVLNVKSIRFPKWLVLLFITGYLIITVFTYKSIFDVLPFIALCIFSVSIIQEKSRICRILSVLNSITFLVYDVSTQSYSAIITHGTILLFLIVGILRLDLAEWKRILKNKSVSFGK